MRPKRARTLAPGLSRREFLRTVGSTGPTITLMDGEARGAPRTAPQKEAGDASGKFTPIELGPYFNASAQDFGTREKAALIGGESAKDSMIRVPGGKQNTQGIPFILGPEDLQSKRWIVLSGRAWRWLCTFLIPREKSPRTLCWAKSTPSKFGRKKMWRFGTKRSPVQIWAPRPSF